MTDSALNNHQIEKLNAVFNAQKTAFQQNMMPSYNQRIDLLNRLEKLLLNNQQSIIDAINQDFGCHPEALTKLVEIMPTVLRIRHTKSHLKKWMKPQSRSVNRTLFGFANNKVVFQPVGVVGNISPWNFPFDISLGPLVDILAAGNRVIIKPSELTPACSTLLDKLISDTFEPEFVAVITGDIAVSEAFSHLPWDHLIFTGGPEIGKKIMKAASENLVPVTLELGGKCPAIIAQDNFTAKTVSSIISTKMIKNGQMCVTPDYVFVPEEHVEEFVALTHKTMQKMFPTFVDNADSTSIISQRHYQRLRSYIDDAKQKNANVIEINHANETPNETIRKFPFTLVINPDEDLAVMKNEIFGPILPIKTYKTLDEVFNYINSNHRPLALYCYTNDKKIAQRAINQTITGGVCINAAATHGIQASLPFGGIGNSGMGHHHGHEGFLTFTKIKPIFEQSKFDGTALLHPPYGKFIHRFLKFVLGK